MAVTATEVLVELKRPPRDVFGEDATHPNHVVFRLGPDVDISLGARTKLSGDRMVGQDVELVADHHVAEEVSPYQRLLTDAMDGDAELFSRQDVSSDPGRSSTRSSATRRPCIRTRAGRGGLARRIG